VAWIVALLFLVAFLSGGGEVAQLERGEAQAGPPLGGVDKGAEHQLERQ